MPEIIKAKEKTLLVTIKLNSKKDGWNIEGIASELEELVRSCGVEIFDNIYCKIDKPTPDLFIGKGKAGEIALLCQEEDIDTVIFSHDISGTQQRNLEEIIGKKTIDRTQIILEIFCRHAKSQEGQTQVELAQLGYLMPRLVGKGIMLSRLGGGIGTRGPGERKLEVDRRRIRKRIDKLKKDLFQLSRHRKTIRKKRRQEHIPTIVLVGYTNAGKSTLLNTLTYSDQEVRDSLFTTLDPLTKALKLPNGHRVVISDTVGFLHNLPYHLIEAFKATLEEVQEADLLIHVLDISSSLVQKHNQAVLEVLKQLDADKKPKITALNKIDLMDDTSWLERLKKDFINSVPISAKFNQNLEILLKEVQLNLKEKLELLKTVIPLERMDLVDLFYREGKVKNIKYSQKSIEVEVELPKFLIDKILKNKEAA